MKTDCVLSMRIVYSLFRVVLIVAIAAQANSHVSGGDAVTPSDDAALPKAVSHAVLPSGSHEYMIRGLDLRGQAGRDNTTLERLFKEDIPDCLTATFDVANSSITIVTSREIADLPKTIDALAHGTRIMPFWVELCARDKRSDSFNANLYHLVYEKAIDFPCGASRDMPRSEPGFLKVAGYGNSRVDFVLYSRVSEKNATFLVNYSLCNKDRKYFLETSGRKIPKTWEYVEEQRRACPEAAELRYAPGKKGVVRFNKAASYCMCCPQYAMRVFDRNDRFIWEEVNDVFGEYYPMVLDFQGDGVDEIVVYREEHGKASILVFRAIPEGPFQDGGKLAQAGTLWPFTSVLRLTVGREIWEGGKRARQEEVVFEDSDIIAHIVGKITLRPTTAPSCEHIEWMNVETEYTTFRMNFCEHNMTIVRGENVSSYEMPEGLYQAISEACKLKGMTDESERLEVRGDAIRLRLVDDGRKAPFDTPHGGSINVRLEIVNASDAEVMIFPKDTFYAVKDGKAVILKMTTNHSAYTLKPNRPLTLLATLPCPPTPGTWELFASLSHSPTAYQYYLDVRKGAPLFSEGSCPTRKRRALPKVCVDEVFSSSITAQFPTGESNYRARMRESGQYQDDYATPRDDPRKARQASPE